MLLKMHLKNLTCLGFWWLTKSIETIKIYNRSFFHCYSLCFSISMTNHILFSFHFQLKACLCKDIVEIKFLNSLSQCKKYNLREQFILLVEIPFYGMYFPESASSIPSQLNLFWVNKITLKKRSNGLYNLLHHKHNREAKIGKKLFPVLVLREKKPWERGRVNHNV